jgi:hypothetical protein
MSSFKGTVAPDQIVLKLVWPLRIQIADGYGILKLPFNFFSIFFDSPSGVTKLLRRLHVIRRFRLQLCMRCSILYAA